MEASTGQHSPSRPSGQFRVQHSGRLQQSSVHQMMDDFGSSDAFGSSALFDSTLNEASGNSISLNESRQHGWDGRSFDCTEFLATNDDVLGGLGSSLKVICLLSSKVKRNQVSANIYTICIS